MAEVVEHSTSKFNDSDLHAIATYLKDLPGAPPNRATAASQEQMNAGKAIFSDTCAACHQNSGEGVPRMFPPLKGNANVQSDDPTSTIRVILEGARTVTTDSRPTPSAMPSFGWKLNDEQVAAVATFVRNSWGNSAPSVSADQVKTLRRNIHREAQANTRERR
jgi:mono/diheme cytochrome c family protein